MGYSGDPSATPTTSPSPKLGAHNSQPSVGSVVGFPYILVVHYKNDHSVRNKTIRLSDCLQIVYSYLPRILPRSEVTLQDYWYAQKLLCFAYC